MSSLPANVHISSHPCLQAKLSQLRSSSTSARETKALVHEIALILGIEATARAFKAASGPADKTTLGYEYTSTTIAPTKISLVPILRSGLGMVEAVQTILPIPVPVHHLGLFREPTTLEPVEYYNNLPTSTSSSSNPASDVALLLDPIIATGGTCAAAIATLREWGVAKVVVVSVLGAREGVVRAASEWPEGVEVFLGGLDEKTNEKGYITPGLGDIGDRLFLTIGK